jgi:hypothetical protein
VGTRSFSSVRRRAANRGRRQGGNADRARSGTARTLSSVDCYFPGLTNRLASGCQCLCSTAHFVSDSSEYIRLDTYSTVIQCIWAVASESSLTQLVSGAGAKTTGKRWVPSSSLLICVGDPRKGGILGRFRVCWPHFGPCMGRWTAVGVEVERPQRSADERPRGRRGSAAY